MEWNWKQEGRKLETEWVEIIVKKSRKREKNERTGKTTERRRKRNTKKNKKNVYQLWKIVKLREYKRDELKSSREKLWEKKILKDVRDKRHSNIKVRWNCGDNQRSKPTKWVREEAKQEVEVSHSHRPWPCRQYLTTPKATVLELTWKSLPDAGRVEGMHRANPLLRLRTKGALVM